MCILSKNKLTVFLVLLLTFYSSTLFAVHPELESFLSNEQYTHLKNASDNNSFTVDFLTGAIEGKPRLVILLGETHVKTATSANDGLTILNDQRFRGLEGFYPQAYWAGNVLNISLLTLFKLLKIVSFGALSGESTIYTAAKQSHTYEDVTSTLDVFEKAALEKNLYNLSDTELKTFQITLQTDSGSIDFTAENLLQTISYLKMEKLRIEKGEPIVNLPLEKGHKPKLGEHIASILIPMQIAAFASVFIKLPLALASMKIKSIKTLLAKVPQSVKTAESWFLGYVLVETVGSYLSKDYFQDNEYWGILFPLHALVNSRNAGMVEGIINGFKAYPNQNVMLVIVGNQHASGLTNRLTKDYNFTQIENALQE